MATPILLSAFSVGEVSPALFGRFDAARLHQALATCRNFFAGFRGGAYSRAGTAFVGFSKQTGRSVPPRVIQFQFNINQGLVLEFGNFYMRVISDGAPVTEAPFQITGISNTNPATVTYASLSTASSASANLAAVSGSYARGDTVTLAGGSFTSAAVLRVLDTSLAKLNLNAPGSGYAVGDRVTLVNSGSVTQSPVVLTVLTLSGSGIATFAISNGGIFTSNGSVNFTQLSTTGSGTGATFNGALWGPNDITIGSAGSYTSLPSNPVNQASTTGTGVGATFTMAWMTPGALANLDWVFIQGVGGMTQVNGQTYIIQNVTPTTFQLLSVYNQPIDATAYGVYTSGGTASRIYTVATIYSEDDLRYLKFTQSADVMSICCVNQLTQTEYPPQDLNRISDTNWTFSQVIPAPTVLPPAAAPVITASTGTGVDYSYVVTSINPNDGTESVASAVGSITNAVNVDATAGTITVTWLPQQVTNPDGTTQNVQVYEVYKATPGVSTVPPPGALFGFAGEAYGTQLLDSGIVSDFSTVPPLHKNPFAPGQIVNTKITNGGSGSSFTVAINSLTGSGAVLTPIVVSSVLVGFIINDPGENYLPTDTLTLSGGATATLVIGPETGTYPSVPCYTQDRRVYANTLNLPDTYFMSQPGAFTNFDSRIPSLDSDAIIGSPWAVQVDGIQFMLNMPGGLVIFTGTEAWQLTGNGGSSFSPQPLTPSSQQAQPQTSNGCSSTVGPIKIESDIIYLTAKGSFYYSFEYQIATNIYTGRDVTINSPHLFTGYEILEHAWCQQPYRLMWAIRDDGVLLSLTYYKDEKVIGWTRHDTQGEFVSVCSITEPPVDALYLATQRNFGTSAAYVIERMDNRIWAQSEDCWCVDCGFSNVQPTPSANLTASSATGLGSLTGVTGLVGGSGYSAGTTAAVVDDNGTGPGTGAVPTLTIVGGVITAVTFAPGNQGAGYTFPALVFNDPAGSAGGSGASAAPILNNTMTFQASANVFASGNVGNVIRAGGGMAVITAYNSAQNVTANLLSPIVQVTTDNLGNQTPKPIASGNWTMTAPLTTVSVPQLAGATVTGLADGNVIPAQVVPASGLVMLPAPSTAIIVGLGFQAQFQTVYLDAGEPTVQGQRKKIAGVTLRVEASRGGQSGTNQRDGSTMSPAQVAVPWNSLTDIERPKTAQRKPYNAVCPLLYSGDERVWEKGGFGTAGQVAVQQTAPLPLNITALVPEDWAGDIPEQKAQPRQKRG